MDFCKKSDFMRLTGAKEVNGVYLGEEGYLIEKWLPQEIDMEQLEENITVLNTYAKMYPKQKISVMIVPTAGAILHEKMPENAPYIKQDRLMEFVERELCKNVSETENICNDRSNSGGNIT